MKTRFWMPVLLLAVALVGVQKLRAADSDAAPGVARVSLLNGEVSTQRGDTGDWTAATLNQPLVTGDKISTGEESRTEVQLDYADILRLSSQSEAKIANLSRTRIQVQIAQGLADVTVLKGAQGNIEIDTPNVSVHPTEPGVYRIQVDSQSQTHVTVRKGQAQVSTPQGSASLNKNETMNVEGTDNPQYQIAKASKNDDWDQWNDERNNKIEEAQSWKYDNRYYTGTQDLDTYGHWTYVPGYNWCWTPYVDDGWIPYYNGRWNWEPYYGWTWVSYEPWGWAPYHYGRWFFHGNSWCWWPGPVYPAYRPIWAPAYVSFFGFGGRIGGLSVGIGFGFGRIGWLPVGPCDPYYRWYGYRGGYNVVNITNIRNVTNVRNYGYVSPLAGRGRPVYSNIHEAMTNARVRRAIITVPHNEFAAGNVPRGRSAVLSEVQFRQASLVSGRVPVVPTRASLSPSARAASRGSIPSTAVSNRRFFTTHQPPAGPRPFTAQVAGVQRMIQANHPNAPGSRTANERGAIQSPTAHARVDNRAASSTSARQQNGAVRYSAGAPNGRTAQNTQTARPGWRSFGTGAAPASANSISRRAGTMQSDPRNASTRNGHESTARPGWRSFGSPSSSRSAAAPSGRREEPATGRSPRAQETQRAPANASSQPARAGWQRFSNPGNQQPQNRARSRSTAPQSSFRNSSRSSSGNSPAHGARAGWQNFRPQSRQAFRANGSVSGARSSAPRASGWGGWASRGSSEKPALQLNKPIVTSRAPRYSARGGGSRNYSASRPAGGVSRGGGSRGGGGGFHGHAASGGSHGRR